MSLCLGTGLLLLLCEPGVLLLQTKIRSQPASLIIITLRMLLGRQDLHAHTTVQTVIVWGAMVRS